jgi:hypothetical protein
MLGSIVVLGCAGSAHESGTGGGDGGYGAAYEGDGLQCGALICSGSQVCCIVPIASDASSMGPAGKCDEGCESVCADSCPDAGNASMPMGGGPGGMPSKMPGAGMSTDGSSGPGMPGDAMAGPAAPGK